MKRFDALSINGINKGVENVVKIFINEISVSFLVDCGANISLIDVSIATKLNLMDQLDVDDVIGETANGSHLDIRGSCNVTVNIGNRKFLHRVYVAKLTRNGICGQDILSKIGLFISASDGKPPAIVCFLEKKEYHLMLLDKYKDVFDKPLRQCEVKTKSNFCIVDTGTSEAIQCRVRKNKKTDEAFIKTEVIRLLGEGVISESHSAWRSQPLVVDKLGGGLRMCINKAVNACTKTDAFPLPPMSHVIDKIQHSSVYSKIDLKQCYYQLPLIKEDREKTAFYACDNSYEFNRVPFGLKNAVALCFRVLLSIFNNRDGIILFTDDILVCGVDQKDHDKKLEGMLHLIRANNICLNKKKCLFSQTKINYLGFIFEKGTKRPDPERLGSIKSFILPKEASSLQRFLGMTGFFQNYIQNYSNLVHPLQNKLKDFGVWTPTEIIEFEDVKQNIVDAILYIPEPNEKLYLRTDASDTCISGILCNGNNRPIMCCSRVLSISEKNYDIVEKEALAIFFSVIKCRDFLLGRKFVIYSDHKPLQFLFNGDKSSPKVIRWRLQLLEFDFEVQHISGKENAAADCLSRVAAVSLNDFFITVNDIKRAQVYCSECKDIKLVLEKRFAKKPAQLSIKIWQIKSRLSIKNEICYVDEKIFVPYKSRLKLLTAAHGGHLGIDGTYERLRNTFFWPKIRKECVEFVKQCRICALAKPRYVQPTRTNIVCKCPFETLAIDFCGPLDKSDGFEYMLVVVDVYSRYTWAFATKTMETYIVIHHLKSLFSMFGVPDSILSDRGTNFESHDFKNFCFKLGIKKLTTTAYNPKCNGICERTNKTLKSFMKQFIIQDKLPRNSWSKLLNSALFEMRTAVHFTTNFRPCDLLFTFQCRGRVPFLNGKDKNAAVENILKNRDCSKYNQSKKQVTFKMGEQVLVKPPPRRFGQHENPRLVKIREDHEQYVVVEKDNTIDKVAKCRVAKLPQPFFNVDKKSKSLELKENFSTTAKEVYHNFTDSADDESGEEFTTVEAGDATNVSINGQPEEIETSTTLQEVNRRSGRLRRVPQRFHGYSLACVSVPDL